MLSIEGVLPARPDRREFLAGAASAAVAAVLPVLPAPAIIEPVVLWPQETREQRQALIVHIMREFIAERENRPEASVTIDDIHDRTRYFGHSREETAAGDVLAKELNQRFPRARRPAKEG